MGVDGALQRVPCCDSLIGGIVCNVIIFHQGFCYIKPDYLKHKIKLCGLMASKNKRKQTKQNPYTLTTLELTVGLSLMFISCC